MDKKQTFLLVLITAFFALLVLILELPQKPVPVPPIISLKSLQPFNRKVEIVLAGDVMLGRSVLTKSERMKDWVYPFRKVSGELGGADLVLVNLESPFVDNCPRSNSGMKFCSDPQMVAGLVSAGVDLVNLANNHSANYSEEGITRTKQVLASAKIDFVGEGNLVVRTVKGTKFGFLGFNFVSRPLSRAELELVRQSDKKVEVLVVSVHWGEEYRAKPTDNQKLIAKNLVDAGADVVAGHHPHWVGETEYIEDPTSPRLRWARPVYYSLGNFVFDQPWSEATKKGLVVRLTFKDGKLQKEEKLPVYMSSLGQPEFVNP